jgi:hypothetical protein
VVESCPNILQLQEFSFYEFCVCKFPLTFYGLQQVIKSLLFIYRSMEIVQRNHRSIMLEKLIVIPQLHLLQPMLAPLTPVSVP